MGFVLTLIQDDIYGLIKEKKEGKYGIRKTLTLYLRNKEIMKIITSYIPCYNNNPKHNMYNYQLYDKINSQETLKLTHPKCVQEDIWKTLTEYFQELHQSDHEVIIGFDANSNANDPKIRV